MEALPPPNYGAHKHAKVCAWLEQHSRFVFHYTPTSASWLNAVEGFFAKLTKRRLKRGVFRTQAAINRFVAETNNDPKPFVWTADPDRIIAAVKRGHHVLNSLHVAALGGDFHHQPLAVPYPYQPELCLKLGDGLLRRHAVAKMLRRGSPWATGFRHSAGARSSRRR